MEKLKSAEEQLEKQGRIMEQVTARNSELEFLYEYLAIGSELKLREAKKNFIQALHNIELDYQEVVNEVSEVILSCRAELAESSMKLVFHEETIDELKSKVLEAETKARQYSFENERLVETNLNLKQEVKTHQIKINELQEQLSAAHMEKAVTAEQLDSLMKILAELRNQHSRGLELRSGAESRVSEAELQLQEAIEGFIQRDYDTKDLNKRQTIIVTQLKISEEHANESAAIAESRKVEQEVLLKLYHLEGIVGELQGKASQFETENEGIVEAKFRLTQDLAAYETQISELQPALKVALVEKEIFFEQLHSSKKTMVDLTQQLAAEGHKRQSQPKRLGDLNKFKTGECIILICTGVASRGLDIPFVDVVITNSKKSREWQQEEKGKEGRMKMKSMVHQKCKIQEEEA